MAKILGDSVLVSKPNAPMDARTEVDTLADVSKIENPAPSLIIWDKETEKHYTIKEMEEVQIEGTSYTKKVIKSVEPMVAADLVGYEEIGDTDLDDVFDQMDVEVTEVGDAPVVDFDSLG